LDQKGGPKEGNLQQEGLSGLSGVRRNAIFSQHIYVLT
jgi:hypothetical protein